MQCPKCGEKGRVTGTINHGSAVQRYHRCTCCPHRWKSWEERDPIPVRQAPSSPGDLFDYAEKQDDKTGSE